MAINFIQEKKKQKYMLFASLIIFLVAAVVLWLGFFKKEGSTPSLNGGVTFLAPLREIRIDFEFLKSQTLKDLRPFEEIPPLVGDSGRIIPFLPY